MSRCGYCQRSSPLLRTNSHGVCKKCGEEIQSNSEAERERIKGNLIYARYMKDRDIEIQHLQSALDSAKKLLTYEKLGCPQTSPTPKALKAFLEEKLREATDREEPPEAQVARQMARALDEPTRAEGQPPLAGVPGGANSPAHRNERGDQGGPAGTRRSRRHPVMFGVWMDHTTPALTEDISPQGLCIRSSALLKPGTRIGVTLDAPDGPVSGDGMVRWAQLEEADDGGPEQAIMGVEFLAPPPELQGYG